MSRESDSRHSSGSSHHVVNFGTTEGIAFCIFRAPPSLSEVNQKAYQPKIVPIGPYHHGEPHFRKIQKHKRRFFTDLLHRTNQPTHKLEYFAKALESEENKIKRCYSEELDFSGDKLIEMMVLDGCFIIELFCKYKHKSQSHTHPKQDPLLTEEWRLPVLMQDLAKLENQIPWFVLECLFNLTLGPSNERYPSLFDLALSFFNRMLRRPNDVLQKASDKEAKHLLHLLLLTYDGSPPSKRQENKFLRLIQPVNKLHQAGIKFKPKHCESFMDIKFSVGVLEIPVLKFDDFLSCLFLNFIAFEQCHRGSSKHATAYATFMACLLNTPADAEFLCNRKIIERYFGTDEKIAHFFSNIGKDVVFDIRKNHLSQVFEDVNAFCEKDFRVYWASFKNTYFKSRWYLISAIAASILLVLSAIQSSYAVIAYYRPSS